MSIVEPGKNERIVISNNKLKERVGLMNVRKCACAQNIKGMCSMSQFMISEPHE